MKCLICGKPSLPGAKLCADCRAARKRAFAATVTQPLLAAAGTAGSSARLLKPSQSVAATARRAAERALFVRPPPPAKIVRWWQPTDLLLLAAAIVTILFSGAYAAHRINVAPKAETTQLAEQPTVQDRPGMRADAPAAEAVGPAAADLPATATASVPTMNPDAPKRAGARQRAARADAPPPVEIAPATEALAVAPVIAPAVEAREAPRPDPWQLMNENIARCSGDLIDRIVCDQRVRRQFCDGHWGQVPQCSSSVGSDHGQ